MNMSEFLTEMDAMQARVVGHDYSDVLEECHKVAVAGVGRAFDNRIGFDGYAWAPRKDTANTAPLMNVTGQLRAAATGGPDHVRRIGGNVLLFGVAKGIGSLAGAAVHQFGAIIRPVRAKMLSWVTAAGRRVFARQVKVPARPYLGMDAETREVVGEIIGQGFGEVIRGRSY